MDVPHGNKGLRSFLEWSEVNPVSDNGQGEKVTRKACPKDQEHCEGLTGQSDGTGRGRI